MYDIKMERKISNYWSSFVIYKSEKRTGGTHDCQRSCEICQYSISSDQKELTLTMAGGKVGNLARREPSETEVRGKSESICL